MDREIIFGYIIQTLRNFKVDEDFIRKIIFEFNFVLDIHTKDEAKEIFKKFEF